jgi:hypothetical protein
MTFIAGFALGALTIIGVSLILAGDLDNNDD